MMLTTLAIPSGPIHAVYANGHVTVSFKSGQSLTFPANITPRLRDASPEQLSQMELLPLTIHWPAIDEDISIESLIELGFDH